MSEAALIAVGLLIASAIGAQFVMLYNHVRECRKAGDERARIRGLCEGIKEELTAMRTWRDESLPRRMDNIISDFHGSLSNAKAEIERRLAAIENKR
jgi:flagellar biosynthesis/type III secretory pathway protein FliH